MLTVKLPFYNTPSDLCNDDWPQEIRTYYPPGSAIGAANNIGWYGTQPAWAIALVMYDLLNRAFGLATDYNEVMFAKKRGHY